MNRRSCVRHWPGILSLLLSGIVVLISVSTTWAGGGLDIAILGAPSGGDTWNADVEAKLELSGQFSSIAVFDLAVETPDLLSGGVPLYDAVLVYTDAPGPSLPDLFGDRLADFVDAGGGVVVAAFGHASLPILGRFATDDYYALAPPVECFDPDTDPFPCQDQDIQQTLGVFDAGHPLMTGVTELDGGTGSYHSKGTEHPQATAVARWINGRPLVVNRVVRGTRRIDLNFFPVSNDVREDFWVTSMSGVRLMVNALQFTRCTGGGDPDGDGILLGCDNCAATFNPDQEDQDSDCPADPQSYGGGTQCGDECDTCTDVDGDGFGDPNLTPNVCVADNCPGLFNPTQADGDGDCPDPSGFNSMTSCGDACDPCPNDPLNDPDDDGVCDDVDNCPVPPPPGGSAFNPPDEFGVQPDQDGDGRGDPCDNCVSVFNQTQLDTDFDITGDACDNCPTQSNFFQEDVDGDLVGDVCDVCRFDFNPTQDPGICGLSLFFDVADFVQWQDDHGFDSYNVYAGDLDALRATGSYTQEPGSNPLADATCGVTSTWSAEPVLPAPGKVVFFLTNGVAGGQESSLGSTGSGDERPIDGGCS